jgi:hypothetical protein
LAKKQIAKEAVLNGRFQRRTGVSVWPCAETVEATLNQHRAGEHVVGVKLTSRGRSIGNAKLHRYLQVNRHTSMPEVIMGFGNYVNSPKDLDAWVTGIEDMFSTKARPTPEIIARMRDAYSPATVARRLIGALDRRASPV